jgi:hypothetical protein
MKIVPHSAVINYVPEYLRGRVPDEILLKIWLMYLATVARTSEEALTRVYEYLRRTCCIPGREDKHALAVLPSFCNNFRYFIDPALIRNKKFLYRLREWNCARCPHCTCTPADKVTAYRTCAHMMKY